MDDKMIAALDFEAAYAALDETVRMIEEEALSLDETIDLYARGLRLSERCNALLSAAELRVSEIDSKSPTA